MGSIGATSAVGDVNLLNKNTTPTVNNITAVLANTEYSLVLPSNCFSFLIRARTACTTKLSYNFGLSGTTYVTLLPRTNFKDDNFYASGQSIYFQSDIPGVVFEIITYNT